MTAPTTAGGAVLPVAGYRLNSGHGNHLRETLDDATKAFLWAGKPAWRELTYRDAAQAEIDALRAKLQAMTDDRDSWCAQASARTEDAVRFAAERDALRAEVAALKALRWCKHCGEGTVAGLCRATGKPVEQDDQARDAARYRWLRARLPGSAYRIAGVIYSEGGAGVDTAIDAAIDATKETP